MFLSVFSKALSKALSKLLSSLLLGLSALIILSGCERNVTDGAFLFDTYVTVRAEQQTAERVLSELRVLSDDFARCYDTPADKLDSAVIDDMVMKTDKLCEYYNEYGNGIDIRIGALTRAWGISGDTPRVPGVDEIEMLLKDKSYLDPGAVTKGYALDKAYQTLSDTESEYAVVSMESSVLLYGEKPDGELFQTGIKSPFQAFQDNTENGGYIGYIETEAAFISTSGGYERFFEADGETYIHIIDPKTGYPIETDLASVTVIVPAETENGGIMSDFLSTLILMQGLDGLETFIADDSYTLIAVDINNEIYGDCELMAIS